MHSVLLLTGIFLAANQSTAQNLLVNPGFDRDLSGWTVVKRLYPDSPSSAAAVRWISTDARANPLSGGVATDANADYGGASGTATQCVPISGGTLASFGAKFLISLQYSTARALVTVGFFPSDDCSGTSLGSATAPSMPVILPPIETNSGGLWLPATSQAVVPATTRSARIEVGASATGTSMYGRSYVEAVADDAFLFTSAGDLAVSLLPSAAWINGAGGSYWQTALTLVNPGSSDAIVSLQWLGHDRDGREGYGVAYTVRAGQTLPLDDGTWELNHSQNFGAIGMTSTSSAVILQGETSTYLPGHGSYGQIVTAMSGADLIGATPKTLAPIEEDNRSRTNLVLANAVAFPIIVHVALHSADGSLVGIRDVELLPLGMTH